MSDTSNDSTAPAMLPAPPKRRRWLDWALILVGLSCLSVFGYQTWRYQRESPGAVTGKLMSGLAETDRIPLSPGAAKDYNLLVITMDTTRADHLGCYGNRGVQTPHIDGLAGSGVLFEKAYTPAPSTLPGHATILTGLYPHHHGARANGTYSLPSEQVTLGEMLKPAGYATGAVISAYVLDSRFGLDQGFDAFNDDLTKGVKYADHSFRERPAELTNEAAFAWLDENAGGKFFLWVHYFDDHAPYLPPEPFRTQYRANLYNGEIAYVDQEIGRLLGKLEALGVRDRTLIVLAGDHGESLGEHGEQTHALLIYDATLHTPLIFHCPSLFDRGYVVRGEKSNADIAPTVLELLGVPSETRFDGVSLLAGGGDQPRSIYAESIATLVLHGWAPLFALRADGFKYIRAPRPELYDLRADPKELRNVLDDPAYAERAAALGQELDDMIGGDKFGAEALQQAVQMDPETAKRLRDLGYVATHTSAKVDAEAAAIVDPKDMIAHWEKLQQALAVMAAGELSEAITELEQCVEAVPGDVFALRNLATAYHRAGRADDAERTLLAAEAVEKNEPGIYTSLSTVAMSRGRLGEAKEWLDRALEVDPNYAPIYVQLGDLAASLNRPEEAEAQYRKAIAMDPGTTGPGAYYQMGMLFLNQLKHDEARAAFESALEIDALDGSAHAGLGSIYAEEGELDKAREEFATALRFNPNQPIVLAAMAGLLDKLGEYEEARKTAERALELNASLTVAMNNLALVYKHTGQMDKAVELFQRALASRPNDLTCRINLAQCYYGMRDEERAVEEYEKVLAINPRVPIALANLGVYHEQHGRMDKAYEFYARAVKADPDYAFAHAHLGAMLLQRGQAREALEHFRKSLELDPEQAGREQVQQQIDVLAQAIDRAEGRKDAADTNGP